LVVICPSVSKAALFLLEEAARSSLSLLSRLQNSAPDLLACTAAAFWTSAKLLGVRTSSPNGVLMSQASQVELHSIIDMEILLLETVNWDVAAVLLPRGVQLC